MDAGIYLTWINTSVFLLARTCRVIDNTMMINSDTFIDIGIAVATTYRYGVARAIKTCVNYAGVNAALCLG